MLDGHIKKIVDPVLNAAAMRLADGGITANGISYAGFVAGIAAMSAIGMQYFLLGLACIVLNRLCDGLDGAVARHSSKTDYGGYIDIVLDFAFYGAIPVGFVIADPAVNGLAGVVLVLSFYVNGASFLAYAALAEKRAMVSQSRGEKSLYFTTGLAEATETVAVFALMCVLPRWFGAIAYLFAALCFYTAFARILLARRNFS